MPRRKKRTLKRHYVVTLGAIAAAVDIRMWEDYWGGEEEGRNAWAALKDEWPGNSGTRPEPFWNYEPDLPEDLREIEPLDPRIPHQLGEIDPEVERLRWLLAGGAHHLREGEAVVIRRDLEIKAQERERGQ